MLKFSSSFKLCGAGEKTKIHHISYCTCTHTDGSKDCSTSQQTSAPAEPGFRCYHFFYYYCFCNIIFQYEISIFTVLQLFAVTTLSQAIPVPIQPQHAQPAGILWTMFVKFSSTTVHPTHLQQKFCQSSSRSGMKLGVVPPILCSNCLSALVHILFL